MSDTQSAAPNAQAGTLSIVQAAAKLAEQRTADARRAEAAGQVMGDEPEEEDSLEPIPAPDPDVAPVEAEGAGADGLIDLGDGVKVTLEQVREGFMLKADHTRKTQALAEERRALERDRKVKLSRLDEALTRIQEQSGPPKPLQAFLAEDPARGLQRFVEQTDRHQRIAAAREQLKREREDQLAGARKRRDEQLAADYWTSRAETEKGIADAAAYAKSYGHDEAALTEFLADPSVIIVLDKARKYEELQAGKAHIERLIADKPKVVRPGAKVSAQAAHQSAVQGARSKLKATGSLSDAVTYLQAQRKVKTGLSR